jgi:hypothetical protein
MIRTLDRTPDELDELLRTIESIMVDAGECCPDDYQSGFDWKLYGEAMEAVKGRIVAFVAGVEPPNDQWSPMVCPICGGTNIVAIEQDAIFTHLDGRICR